MKLIKREDMNPRMNPLFGSFLSDEFFNWPTNGYEKNRGYSPAVNISENENGFTLDVAAPGLQKEDFTIKIEDDLLTISAEVKTESEDKTPNYTRKEFGFKSFKRSFRITEEQINQDEIKASYENGVLSIQLPKKEEAKPLPARSISIS